MSNDSTLKCDGLYTRFGADVIEIHGFAHRLLDKDDYIPQGYEGKGLGTWWTSVTLRDPKSREVWDGSVDLCRIVYDPEVEGSRENRNELDAACMDYLMEHGHFHKGSYWIPKAA